MCPGTPFPVKPSLPLPSKAAQVRMCGNSVSPPIACARQSDSRSPLVEPAAQIAQRGGAWQCPNRVPAQWDRSAA